VQLKLEVLNKGSCFQNENALLVILAKSDHNFVYLRTRQETGIVAGKTKFSIYYVLERLREVYVFRIANSFIPPRC
jgi:hypothetical protein